MEMESVHGSSEEADERDPAMNHYILDFDYNIFSRCWQLTTNWLLRSLIFWQFVAEFLGTMFIVVFGVGSVCSAVTSGAHSGLWGIAATWGFGVSLAIYMTADVSGAHLNPAVSLAFAIWRSKAFPRWKLIPYWIAQFSGATFGGAINLLFFATAFEHFEHVNDIERGTKESVVSASAFGEYFPNPGAPGFDYFGERDIGMISALATEAWGTGILMFVILSLTDHCNQQVKKGMAPFLIGFTVAVLISVYAPLTQAGWNPARDFGPRLVAAMAGWGKVAIPGPKNGFWVYIIGPMLGAPIGALVYDLTLKQGMRLAAQRDPAAFAHCCSDQEKAIPGTGK